MARTRKNELFDVECACCGFHGTATPRDGVVKAWRTRTRQCVSMPDVWICTVCYDHITNKKNLLDLSTTADSGTKVGIV